MTTKKENNEKTSGKKVKTGRSGKNKYFKSRKDSFQEIAINRINELFSEAEKSFEEEPKLSNRYVFLARQMALKFKVPFTKEQKIRFCKKCNSFLVHGKNARIRLSKGNIVVNCGLCKNISRMKYK